MSLFPQYIALSIGLVRIRTLRTQFAILMESYTVLLSMHSAEVTVAPPPSPTSGPTGLSAGEIVGIVIGIVAFVLLVVLIVLAVLWYVNRRRKSKTFTLEV